MHKQVLQDSQGYVYCVEGDIRDASSWRKFIKVSSETFESLVGDGVFRRLPAKSDGQFAYSLQLVGVVFTASICLIALPKTSGEVTSDLIKASDLALTLKVIEKYRGEMKRAPSMYRLAAETVLNGTAARLVDLFKALLKWTDRHGFHKEDQHGRVERNGAVNWAATLRSGLALHGDGFTVYDRPVLVKRRQIEGRLYAIQIRALCDLKAFLGPIADVVTGALGDVLREAETLALTLEQRQHDRRRVALHVKAFLQSANLDHERELAKVLLGVYGQELVSQRLGVTVYGSISFGFVWQSIIDCLLASYKSRASYKTLACSLKHHTDDVSSSWLLPDHVVCFPSGNEDVIILDSKWHLPEAKFASEDITKQLMYELSVRAGCSVGGNAFLAPCEGNEVILSGELMPWIDDAKDPRFPSIRVVGIPWRQAFQAYLDNSTERFAASVLNAARR